MAKRKRRRTPKTKKFRSNIPETANPKRFLVFLAIGLLLFAIFYYFAVIKSGTIISQ
jgi:hypothetical protein